MRLIHTETLKLQQFFDENVPTYAILSHRWEGEDEEVSLQDLENGLKKEKSGYSKIVRCCARAASDGYMWAWIDTCCIDKTSSADLSEAINSMYRWYARAAVCYAYLSDVRYLHELGQSKWFTRGWTLQELLAPRNVIFLDVYWNDLGTREGLSGEISVGTRIWPMYLTQGITGLGIVSPSVAMKISWASQRKTSRLEDIAYCLLGIFDINMPLIYGEGKRAFLRFQTELIKTSDDESLFAWEAMSSHSPHIPTLPSSYNSLLAPSPAFFGNSINVTAHPLLPGDRPPYFMTNKGLQMIVPLRDVPGSRSKRPKGPQEFLLPLNCQGFDKYRSFAVRMRIDTNSVTALATQVAAPRHGP